VEAQSVDARVENRTIFLPSLAACEAGTRTVGLGPATASTTATPAG